jgi:segregation and condensation protein A
VPSPEPIEAGEDGEEPIDPREELIRRLLEYQKYKHAAADLGNRPIEGRNVFVRGVPLEAAGEAGLAEHSVWKLLEHWAQILEKAKPKYTHDVVIDRMSITDRINQVVDMLESGKGRVRFEDLLGEDLPEAELRHKIVVSLLAVLELARLRVIRVLQDEVTGTFFLAQVEGAGLDEARNITVTSATVPDGAPETEAASADVAEDPAGVPAAEGPDADALEAPAEESEAGEQSLEALAQDLEAEAASLEASAEASGLDVEVAAWEAPDEDADTEVAGSEAPVEDLASPVEESTEGPAQDVEIAEAPVGEIASPEGPPEDVAGDAIELPSHDVISASFPASADKGEEVTDGQTQEEQREDTHERK